MPQQECAITFKYKRSLTDPFSVAVFCLAIGSYQESINAMLYSWLEVQFECQLDLPSGGGSIGPGEGPSR